MATRIAPVIMIAAGAGLAALRWWRGCRQQQRSVSNDQAAELPALPAPAPRPSPRSHSLYSPPSPPPGEGVQGADLPPLPPSPPPEQLWLPRAPTWDAIDHGRQRSWLVGKAERLAAAIKCLEPSLQGYTAAKAELQERARQLLDLLDRNFDETERESAWSALRNIRFVPVEANSGVELPAKPVNSGFEAPARAICAEHSGMRFQGQHVLLQRCGACPPAVLGMVCPNCRPSSRVLAALGVSSHLHLAAPAQQLMSLLSRGPPTSSSFGFTREAVQSAMPPGLTEAIAPEPATPSLVIRDLESLLHPCGPIFLDSPDVARLRQRIASEAIRQRFRGRRSIGRRLEEAAAALPRGLVSHPLADLEEEEE